MTTPPPSVALDHAYRLQIAKEAAFAAGKIQQNAYGKPISIETKSSGIDLVTQIDLACDQAITEILTSAFPSDTLMTEETFHGDFSHFNLDSAWIVDPLDGTTNFAHSFPHFAVSIAYLEQGQPAVGVIYDVIKDELFYAMKGQGAFLEKPQAKVQATRIHTSHVNQLNQALLATGFPYDIGQNERNNLKYLEIMLKSCHGVRRPGAAALDLAYVASGRLDGFWEITLSPWDLAAGVLIVEEAGGQCQDLNQKTLNYQQRRIDIASANSAVLLAQMQDVLNTQTQIPV